MEEALMEAHADIAALGLVTNVKTCLDAEADKLAKSWFGTYKEGRRGVGEAWGHGEAWGQASKFAT